jgi:RHS repeat-associated protein
VSYAYDGAGRLSSMTADDGSEFVYHYDVALDPAFPNTAGNLAWVDEPTGRVQLGYDAFGRQSHYERSVDGVASRVVAALSPSGLVLREDFGDGVVFARGYDAAGRAASLALEGDGPGHAAQVLWTATDHEPSGKLAGERYGNGLVQTYGYDAATQLVATTVSRNASPIYGIALQRNAFGAITAIADTDGGAGLDHSAAFGFDGAGRLTDATIGSTPAAFGFRYRYDGLQNMLSRQQVSGPTAIAGAFGAYAYGGGGAGPRQLTNAAGAAMAYDAAGREIAHGGRSLAYNGLDQLIRVDGASSAANVAHAYGFDGQRVRTEVGGQVERWFSSEVVERDGVRDYYLRLGDRLITRVRRAAPSALAATRAVEAGHAIGRVVALAITGSGGLLLLVIVGAGLLGRDPGWRPRAVATATLVVFAAGGCSGGAPLGSRGAALTAGSQILYFHVGADAGPALITREDATVFSERRYEPFGAPIDERVEADDDTAVGAIAYAREPHSALNKPVDPGTGWSDHGARWLAPDTARWLTPDPPVKAPDPAFMAEPWSLHPYQYVDQNPVLYWDPDGEQAATKVTPPASPLRRTTGAGAWVLRTVRFGKGRYKINGQAKAILGPVFKQNFNFDISKVTFEFGWTPSGVAAYTVGNEVVLNEDKWDAMTPKERMHLVAHEMTHSVQYERFGNTSFFNFSLSRFLWRYKKEYGRSDNYVVPGSLASTPVNQVDPVDKSYTLDQIAERVADEAVKGVAGP